MALPETISSKPSIKDKRQTAPVAVESLPDKHFLLSLIRPYFKGLMLQDLISTLYHSEDFKRTRADYIVMRLRFLIFFYAAAILLWIPFDYLLLRPEHFVSMLLPRFLMTAFLLLLGRLTFRPLSSNQVHYILVLTFLAAGIFYFAIMQVLNQGVAEIPLAGYNLMPLLIVSMLGVFPLTLDWGMAIIAVVMVPFLGLETARGQLITAGTANLLWIFMMLGGVSLWVQSSQLLMLLRLYRESTLDPLTGLFNRRVLMRLLTSEIDQLGERKSTFSLMMFDLDRFKRINDNHGHLVGDKVLKTAALIIQHGLRAHDIVARFGGEEFVVVLPNCNTKEAVAIAERIRENCYSTHLTAPTGEDIQISTSVGVTEYVQGEAIEVTLNRVDEFLYKAKELGRNRVVYNLTS